MGSDGGLLASPVVHHRLPISPAERFDVVIDFAQYAVGDQVTLANRFGDGSTAQVMQFRVVREERDDSPIRLGSRKLSGSILAARSRRAASASTAAKSTATRADHRRRRAVQPRDDPTRQATPGPARDLRGNIHHLIHVHLAHFQVLSCRRQPSGA